MAEDKKAKAEDKKADLVTVHVNEKVAKKGGAYHDPDPRNKKPIGKDPIQVVRTPFVAQRLRSGDLEEVR